MSQQTGGAWWLVPPLCTIIVLAGAEVVVLAAAAAARETIGRASELSQVSLASLADFMGKVVPSTHSRQTLEHNRSADRKLLPRATTNCSRALASRLTVWLCRDMVAPFESSSTLFTTPAQVRDELC